MAENEETPQERRQRQADEQAQARAAANNGGTTGAAPAPAPAGTDSKTPTVNTRVTVAGVEYNLKEITDAQIAQLRAALPAEYRTRATEIARVASRFDAVQTSNRPMDFTLGGLIGAINNGSQGANASMNQFIGQAVTTGFQAVNALNGNQEEPQRNILDHGINFVITAGLETVGTPLRMFKHGPAIAGEATGVVGRATTNQADIDRRAERYGVIYAAAMYAEAQTANRTDIPTFGLPFGEKDLFWSYPVKAVDAFFKWLTYGEGSPLSGILTPVATFMNGFGAGVGKFFEEFFGENGFNFSRAFEAAKDAFTQGQQESQRNIAANKGRSYREILVESITNAERTSAAQMVNAAEAFSDQTEALTGLIANGGLMRTRNPQNPAEGRIEAVVFENGGIKTAVLPDSSTTTIERVQEHGTAILSQRLRGEDGNFNLDDKGDWGGELGALVGAGAGPAIVGGGLLAVGVKVVYPIAKQSVLRLVRVVGANLHAIPSGFLQGYAMGRAGGNIPILRGPITSAHDARIHGLLGRINRNEALHGHFFARHQELTRVADSLRGRGLFANIRAAMLDGQARTALDKANRMSIALREVDVPRLAVYRREGWSFKVKQGPIEQLSAVLRNTAFDITRDVETGRHVLVNRGTTTRAIDVNVLRRIPSIVAADSAANALSRVEGVSQQLRQSQLMLRSLNGELSGLLRGGSATDAMRAAAQTVIPLQRATVEANQALSQALRASDATAEAANILRLATEAANAQQVATNALRALQTSSAAALDATKAARLASFVEQSDRLATRATRTFAAADDIVRVAGATVDTTSGVARIMSNRVEIANFADVVHSTPEVLRVLTPDVARNLTGSLNVTAETIQHIPTNTFAVLNNDVFARISADAVAGISSQQWSAIIDDLPVDANERTARLTAIFTAEHLQNVPVNMLQHVPEDIMQTLAVEQVNLLPPPVAQELLRRHSNIIIDPTVKAAFEARTTPAVLRAHNAQQGADASARAASAWDTSSDALVASTSRGITDSRTGGRPLTEVTHTAGNTEKAVHAAEEVARAAEEAARAGEALLSVRGLGRLAMGVGRVAGMCAKGVLGLTPVGLATTAGFAGVGYLLLAPAKAEAAELSPSLPTDVARQLREHLEELERLQLDPTGVGLETRTRQIREYWAASGYPEVFNIIPESSTELIPGCAIRYTGSPIEDRPNCNVTTDGALGNADAGLQQASIDILAAREECARLAATMSFSGTCNTTIGATYAGCVPNTAAPNLIPTGIAAPRPIGGELQPAAV